MMAALKGTWTIRLTCPVKATGLFSMPLLPCDLVGSKPDRSFHSLRSGHQRWLPDPQQRAHCHFHDGSAEHLQSARSSQPQKALTDCFWPNRIR